MHSHPDAVETAQATSDRLERVNRAAAALAQGVEPERNFRLLYESYFRPLQRFFSRHGFGPEECLDLTQETFVCILNVMQAYRDEDRFQSWLYQVAKTTYLKRLRTAASAKRSAHEISHDHAPDAVATVAQPAEQLDTVLDDERRQLMRNAVSDLPKQMRQCMTLYLYQDLSYADIATVMQIKVNTVKAHIFQGRKKLLETLSGFKLAELSSETTE